MSRMEKIRSLIPAPRTSAAGVVLLVCIQVLAHDGIDSHAHRRRPPALARESVERKVPPAHSVTRPFDAPLLQRALTQNEAAFTVAGLPDTQNYSEFIPATFLAQTSWIATNRDQLNIRFVSHFGDVVNHALQEWEWANADAAMTVLDAAGVIYGVCPGNHDITPDGVPGSTYVPQQFLAHFGPQRSSHQPWFGGASPSGMSSFQYFNAGGIPFLALHLDCDTPIVELAWAQGILDTHKGRPAIVTTHKYLQDAEDYSSGVPIVPSGRYPSSWYTIESFYNPSGIQSEDFYAWFLRKNTNIFLVQCGHFHAEYRQTSPNIEGRLIHEVLADFQDDPNGGNGWMRILAFDTERNTIDFDTYSPTLNATRTTDESDFTLSVPFDEYRLPPSEQFRAFQQGVGSYSGARDTWVSEASPDASFGQANTRVSDDDVSNAFFSDAQGQALLRFENIFGAQSIPLDATILSATLVLDLPDDIDSALYSPDFFVYLVERAWEESSTWNSLIGGLTVGSDLSVLLATFPGDNVPDTDTMRRIDVTAAVSLWQQGHPNFGVAIVPEVITGNDDGIEIRTRENANIILRPRLEVVFTQLPAPPCADFNNDRVVNAADLAALLAAWQTQHPFADLDCDGVVGATDLTRLLADWT